MSDYLFVSLRDTFSNISASYEADNCSDYFIIWWNTLFSATILWEGNADDDNGAGELTSGEESG